MLDANSDLSNPAPARVRFNPWTRQDDTSRSPGQVTVAQSAEYDRIMHDTRYRHFARIPARIVRCLDYFHVRGDRIAAARILSAYYIFIAVVDNAIDSGDSQTADIVFEQLAKPVANHPAQLSDVALMTRNLTAELDQTVSLTFRNQLGSLYETVCQERSAGSIEAYIEIRKGVGTLTADLSYILISPLFAAEETTLRAFMQEVGAVGCLVDSVIDLSADRRRGLVSFRPTRRDHIKLSLAALRQGLLIGLRHPRLAGLFVDAILDVVRDRFITTGESMNEGQRQIHVKDES